MLVHHVGPDDFAGVCAAVHVGGVVDAALKLGGGVAHDVDRAGGVSGSVGCGALFSHGAVTVGDVNT